MHSHWNMLHIELPLWVWVSPRIPGSKIVFKHNRTHQQMRNCAPSMKMGVFFWLHPCNPPKERHSIGKSSWNVTGGNLEGSGNVDFCTKQPADKQVLPKSDFWRKTCFCKWWVWSPAWSLRLPPSLTQHLHSFAFAPHCPFAADMNIVLSSVLKICLISSHVWLLWKAIGRESLEDDFFQKTFQLLSRLEAQFNSQKDFSAEL